MVADTVKISSPELVYEEMGALGCATFFVLKLPLKTPDLQFDVAARTGIEIRGWSIGSGAGCKMCSCPDSGPSFSKCFVSVSKKPLV